MSLLLRLSLAVVCVMVLTLGVGAAYLVANVRRAVSDELRSSIELTSALLELQVVEHKRQQPIAIEAWRTRLQELRHTRHLHLSLVDAGAALPENALDLPRVAAVPAWFVRCVMPDRPELVRRIALAGGTQEVVLRADPNAEIAEAWGETRLSLFMLGGFGLIATALVYTVLSRALAPLQALSAALRKFEVGDYDVRLDPSGIADIDRATGSFNHMAAVLSQGRDDMTSLAQRSLAIQEQERQHLAHDLHDGLGQSISAIKALAVSIARKAPVDSGIVASATMIANVSSDMYEQVRSMMARLRPSILDELGLISALASMIDDWNAHHESLFCSFEHPMPLPDLPVDAGINVFRIVQEALTNVVRHSAATTVSVRLSSSVDARNVVLEIEDDGCGFDANTVRRGLGLVGIEERVRAMGGSLLLAAAAGQGTKFRITIPQRVSAG